MSKRALILPFLIMFFIYNIALADNTKTISGNWKGEIISDRGEIQNVEWNLKLKKNNKIDGDGESIVVAGPSSNTGSKYPVFITGTLNDGKYKLSIQYLRFQTTSSVVLTLGIDGDTLEGNGESINIGGFSVKLKRKK